MDVLITDHHGGLYLPPEVLARVGARPGDAVRVQVGDGRLVVRPAAIKVPRVVAPA